MLWLSLFLCLLEMKKRKLNYKIQKKYLFGSNLFRITWFQASIYPGTSSFVDWTRMYIFASSATFPLISASRPRKKEILKNFICNDWCAAVIPA